MFDDLTWDALLQAWPWFAAAATVLVVAVGLFFALKPKQRIFALKPKQRKPDTAADAADWKDWMWTGRIDFADPRLSGPFVLQVEECRISTSLTGVERREVRWRRATLPEAKMVLESYHAQRNLAMTATFTASVPSGTERKAHEQAESVEADSKVVGDGRDMADVTLVPRDVTH